MATIFYSTLGNDTTGTGSIGTPYRTPEKAESVANADDEILGRGGTYTIAGQIGLTLPNGSGGGTYTKLGAYDSEPVVFENTSTANHSVINLAQGAASIWVDGIKIDCASLGAFRSVTGMTLGYEGDNVIFNDDIKVTNMEITGQTNQGIQTAHIKNSILDDIYIHDGAGDDFAHGIYLSSNSSNNTLSNLHIHDITGHGLQVFSTGGTPSNNIIEQFKIYRSGSHNTTKPNIVLLHADNNTIRCGSVYDGFAGGVHCGGNNNKLYHLWVYNNGSGGTNGSGGIAITGGTGHEVRNCVSVHQHASAIFGNYADSGTSTVATNNLFVDTHAATDMWIDPDAAVRADANFTLIASPTAGAQQDANDAVVDQGIDLGIALDSQGLPRKVGAEVDIGGTEWTGATAPDGPANSHDPEYEVTTTSYTALANVTVVKGTNDLTSIELDTQGLSSLHVTRSGSGGIDL